jgi:hypothetical protein
VKLQKGNLCYVNANLKRIMYNSDKIIITQTRYNSLILKEAVTRCRSSRVGEDPTNAKDMELDIAV